MKKNIIFLIFAIFLVILFFPNQTKADDCPGKKGGDEQCAKNFPGYSCISPTAAAGRTDCKSGCCGGDRVCCPATPAGKEAEEEKESAIAKFTGFSAARDIPQLIGLALRIILGLMGSIALLMFVYGGVLWLTSGGSPDKIKKARDILVWATIGLIVIFASYALVDLVIKTVGG
jgi:hypothetical protein